VKRGSKKSKVEFQTRVILAMVLELAAAKEALEQSCALFAALAKSAGVPVEFE
jgi:hypothetical protein